MNYKAQQAEMIYLAILNSLRTNGIEFDDKHERLSDDLLERHEATDLLDLLDGLHDFITSENGIDLEEEVNE